MPRKFSTADDLQKLGSALLIQHRRKTWVEGKPLVGPYYELADGKNTEKLAQSLLKFAEKRRQEEAGERVARAYADQSARVSNNNSTLFATPVVVEPKSALPTKHLSTIAEVSVAVEDSSIAWTGSPKQESEFASPVAAPVSPSSANDLEVVDLEIEIAPGGKLIPSSSLHDEMNAPGGASVAVSYQHK